WRLQRNPLSASRANKTPLRLEAYTGDSGFGDALCRVRIWLGISFSAKPVSAEMIDPAAVRKSEPAYFENQLGSVSGSGKLLAAPCQLSESSLRRAFTARVLCDLRAKSPAMVSS